MITFCENALLYTSGHDRATFDTDTMRFDATVRNLELKGEAATHIPEIIRLQMPKVPWRLVISTRNRLIHGYLGIDKVTLWSLIKDDVPNLLVQLKTWQLSL
jgi:uncharacterized protein with HEPN domain